MPDKFREQNKEENFDNELNEEEKKLLEQSRFGLGRLFDDTKTPQERQDKILPFFQPLFDAGLLDEVSVTVKIQDCCMIEERDIFVEKSLELTKILVLTKRNDVNGVVRKARLRAQNREAINELLDYEFGDNGSVIKIHMGPDKKPGLRKLKELVDAGFRSLAKVVEENKDVKKVQAYSWIIFEHPRLAKELGFTLLEGYATHDGREGQGAEISREEFLRLYGN